MKIAKSKRNLLLGLMIVLAGIMILPAVSHAAVNKDKKRYMDLTKESKKYGVTINEYFSAWYDTGINVKSSDESVIKTKEKDGYLYLIPKKAGKSKITVQFEEAGKITATVMVQKYKNPLKTFKIGKLSFANRFKTYNVTQYSNDPRKVANNLSGKLSVVPAAGWKLVKIEKYDEDEGEWATLKNNKSYTISTGFDRIVITVKDKKTKFVRNFAEK